MRTPLIAIALAATAGTPALALAQAAPAAAPQSPHTLTGNIALVSSYRFRGIDQTFGKPALQGGVDYSHASGFYAGNWNSNVNEGAGFPEGNLEMDFYGGWKGSWGDWGVDVGGIYYYYPGTNARTANGTAFVNPRDPTKIHTGKVDNGELYVAGSWKTISLKYSHAVTDYFSLPDTKGSNYWDLSGTWDLGSGWGLVGHIGKLRLKNWQAGTDASDGDYIDYKIGGTYDLKGWVFGLSYIDTSSSKGSCNIANPGFYCFPDQVPNAGIGSGTAEFKNAARGIFVLSVAKTF
jgi:uncharacterized protein (TIGR02001 family)